MKKLILSLVAMMTVCAVSAQNELIAKFPNNAYARKGMLNKAITERNSKNEASAIEAYKELL